MQRTVEEHIKRSIKFNTNRMGKVGEALKAAVERKEGK